MNDDTTPLVIEIAKEFMSLLQASGQPWTNGFFRFKSEESNYGSTASYVVGSNVFLLSAMRNAKFYENMNEMCRKLFASMGKVEGLLLFLVDDKFNYDIKFEWDNLEKWEITKLDGGTGLPIDL